MFPPRLGRLVAVAAGALGVTACAVPAAAERGVGRAARASEPPSVPLGPTRSTSGMVTDADRAQGVEWRFDAGSTIHASPAVATDGTVYVGTGDGYLLSIGANGVLGWSYTLEGAVAWAPVIDATGRVYVATTAQRLCSFQPSGALAWQSRTPSHVGTELSLTTPLGVLFGGTDGSVWAYSEHGTAVWHVELGARVSAGPRVFGTRSWVGTADGIVVELDGATRRHANRLDAACEAVVAASSDGSVVVLAAGALVGVGPRGDVRFRRDGVALATSIDGGYLAIESDGALVRLGPDGALVSRTAIDGTAVAAPVLGPASVIYVAGASGALAVVAKEGTVRWVQIARAALHRPVLDVARRRVLVTSGNGIVAALRFEG